MWRWRRFRRERGTFLLLLASLRVSSVQPPSPTQRVTYPALSPEPQRGGGEREGAQGEPTDKQSSMKKAPGQNDLVLSCTSAGMRALASLPDVPCLNIIAHRRGVVNTAPASKGICQALAALQIPLTWYNLESPSTGARGRAREKRAGLPAHCAPRAWSRRRHQPPTTTAPPTRKGGTGGRTGDLKGDRARSWLRLCACPPWLAGRPLPREGARRSPRASARLPRTGACAQPPPRAALSALSPTVRGKTREAAAGGAGTPGAHAGMFR